MTRISKPAETTVAQKTDVKHSPSQEVLKRELGRFSQLTEDALGVKRKAKETLDTINKFASSTEMPHEIADICTDLVRKIIPLVEKASSFGTEREIQARPPETNNGIAEVIFGVMGLLQAFHEEVNTKTKVRKAA